MLLSGFHLTGMLVYIQMCNLKCVEHPGTKELLSETLEVPNYSHRTKVFLKVNRTPVIYATLFWELIIIWSFSYVITFFLFADSPLKPFMHMIEKHHLAHRGGGKGIIKLYIWSISLILQSIEAVSDLCHLQRERENSLKQPVFYFDGKEVRRGWGRTLRVGAFVQWNKC